MDIFNRIESHVRKYCRDFPTVFTSGNSSTLIDDKGRSYIDFLSGGGALNYGHNDPDMKKAPSEAPHPLSVIAARFQGLTAGFGSAAAAAVGIFFAPVASGSS